MVDNFNMSEEGGEGGRHRTLHNLPLETERVSKNNKTKSSVKADVMLKYFVRCTTKYLNENSLKASA